MSKLGRLQISAACIYPQRQRAARSNLHVHGQTLVRRCIV